MHAISPSTFSAQTLRIESISLQCHGKKEKVAIEHERCSCYVSMIASSATTIVRIRGPYAVVKGTSTPPWHNAVPANLEQKGWIEAFKHYVPIMLKFIFGNCVAVRRRISSSRKGDVLLDLYGELFRESILFGNNGVGESLRALLHFEDWRSVTRWSTNRQSTLLCVYIERTLWSK